MSAWKLLIPVIAFLFSGCGVCPDPVRIPTDGLIDTNDVLIDYCVPDKTQCDIYEEYIKVEPKSFEAMLNGLGERRGLYEMAKSRIDSYNSNLKN